MPDPGLLIFTFTAGAAATLNPCGFALLPAYVAYVLGRGEPGATPAGGALAGLQGGAAMTGGVLFVFATLGAVLSATSRALLRYLPWASLLIGAAIVLLGLAMLLRRSMHVALPLGNPVARKPHMVAGHPAQLLLFGAGYGVASLGCTLPIFLVVVTQALTAGGVPGGIAVFLAYGLGMGMILSALSVAVATGKTAIVRSLRGLVPHIRTAGALGLVLAGSYLIYYQVTVGRALLLLR